MYIENNKLVITAETKTFHFDLPKVDGINMKYYMYFIIKHHERLAVHTIKRNIRQLLSKYQHENNIHEH